MGLEMRYPELAFITSIFNYQAQEVIWKKGEELSIKIREGVEVVYVYGFSPHATFLIDWVNADPSRDLVFIEDELAVVAKIIEEKHSEIFNNERIHLRVILEDRPLIEFAEALVKEFPFEKLAFGNFKENSEKFEQLKLLLMRKSVVEAAVAAELLHYHRLFYNLRQNFPRLSESSDVGKWKNAFTGIPAIICGAGPSLNAARGELEKIKGRGMIFACGSAISALSSYQIIPDLLFAIDPNQEEFVRLCLHTAFNIPLVYGSRLQPDVFQAGVGDLAYIVSGTGGEIESWLEEELGIEDQGILEGLSTEALSVTSLALKSAIYFGCNPIIFAGVDLSYKEGSRYTPGVVSEMQCALEESFTKASDTLMEREGKVTMAKWLMERDVIQEVIEKHPQIRFIDGTGKGLALLGAEVKTEWGSDNFVFQDIYGKIHELCQRTKFSILRSTVEEKLSLLRASFLRCHEIIEEILRELALINGDEEEREETAKESVLEIDLEEEIAYQVALQGAAYAWTFPIKKVCQKENPKRKTFFIKSRLYRKLQTLVEEYLKIC